MNPALFVGWRPDGDGRRRLAEMVDSLVAARALDAPPFRPRRPDHWHATLCYIGRFEPDRSRQLSLAEPDVLATLKRGLSDVAARMPPLSFTPARLAYWSRPGVIVALPREDEALQQLCDQVRDAVLASGIVPESPTTRPHVTLARLDRSLPDLGWLDDVDCHVDPLPIDGFELLYNAGGRYEPLAGFFRR